MSDQEQSMEQLQKKIPAKAPPAKSALQREAVHPEAVDSVPPIVHEALQSPGQPLNAEIKASMEPHFEHDFSKVRVHTDEKAAESAEAVNAQAYTSGHEVVFGEQQYAPHTKEGKELLAHELTHVVQQEANVHGQAIQRQVKPESPDLSVPAKKRPLSLFPPGEELQLHLDPMIVQSLLNMQGVLRVYPVGPPRWLPALPAQTTTEPGGTLRILECEFKIDVEPNFLARLGTPPESAAQKAQKEANLYAELFGPKVKGTPFEFKVSIEVINALAATKEGKDLIKRLHLNNVTFVFNPFTNTYGAIVKFNF